MIQAIILAAGQSKRMGSPKALLQFDGEAAVERIAGVCRLAGIQKPIVVLGAGAEFIQKEANLRDTQIILNQNWEKGQTSSVKAGVRALDSQAEWFLIWPVDLPLIPFEVVHTLLSAKKEEGNLPLIFVPTFQGKRGHPVRISAATNLKEEISGLGDDQPLHTIIRKDLRRVLEVPVRSELILKDFDRPEDLTQSS